MPDTSLRDNGEPVVRDEAYYAEVRRSLGRGAPTLLVGASTKSLDRSVERLRSAQQPKAGTKLAVTLRAGEHSRASSYKPKVSKAAPTRQSRFIRRRISSRFQLEFLTIFAVLVASATLTLALTGRSSLTSISIIMAVTAVVPLITAFLFHEERTTIRDVTRAIVKEQEEEREAASKSSPSSSGNQGDV